MIKHTPVKNQLMPPNTTQTPNCFFDYYLKILGHAELKVAGAVIRHTYGWHEKDYKFALSLTDLEEATGLARPNVQRAAKRLIVATKTRPAILGRKKAKGGKYLYWLLIHTEVSMGQGVHDTCTPENGSKTPPGVHAACTELYMQHEQQVYMQHVQPINVLKKHVKKHVKPTSSSIVKVPTGKRVMQHDDDDLNKRIPAESTEQQPKISVSSGEFDFEQNQVAARPDLFESSIVIRPNHSSGDGGHDSALVAKWCERLSQGFHWIKNRDGAAYESVVHVRLEHILLGLCYSVARARGHKFSAFSYAVPAILEEYSNSVRYGTEAEELTGLAAHHVAITLTALKSGKWSANDYDEPEWANFKVETRELARTVLALTR